MRPARVLSSIQINRSLILLLSAFEPPWSTISLVSAPAVEFSRVSKSYSIYSAPGERLKELATLNRRSFHTDYWALRDVIFRRRTRRNFLYRRRKRIAAKARCCRSAPAFWNPPTATPAYNGRVSALLELGSGFNPEFSGRDNVYLNGAILGLSTKEMDRRFPEIEAFAEIGDFIQPARQDLFERHGCPSRLRRRDPCRSGNSAGRRGALGRRRLFPPALHAQGARAALPRDYDSFRFPFHRRRQGPGRPRHVAGARPHHGHWKDGSRCV